MHQNVTPMQPQQHDKPLEICIVEDETDLREEIVESLQVAGFHVRGFPASRELYAALLVAPCDIVVLDVGLPGEDGFAITEHLRRLGSIGIIMLTARAQNEDRVRGLQQGADAYLVKPTDLRVLEATIVSLARRLKQAAGSGTDVSAVTSPPTASSWVLSDDGWTLSDPVGSTLALTSQERVFLGYLVARTGTAVTREELASVLSTDPCHYDLHRLDALVNRLRKKAGDLGLNLPMRSIRGIGYVFSGM